ncbi:MAG TPA: glycosyltransferase, partial [Acidimicrobiales bacterium]
MANGPGTVRLVVLNHDGGPLLGRCLDALQALDWPSDELELVVVDNASTDGSPEAVEAAFPGVRLIRTGSNTGFPANNEALRDLTGIRFVGLVNNDAFVEPGWLRAMVGALEADPALGAATGKLVFAPRFVDLVVETPTSRPGLRDHRDLGVRVSGLRVDGTERWRSTQVVGGWGPEPVGADGATATWTSGRSTVRVPLDGPGDRFAGRVAIRLDAPAARTAHLDGGAGPVEVEVGPDASWVELDVAGTTYDVVNNAGGVVFTDGYGADRGFLDPDDGRWDE